MVGVFHASTGGNVNASQHDGPTHWILVGQTPIAVGLTEWARWFEYSDRVISKARVTARSFTYEISTVFLGVDYDFTGKGPPVLFETMIFTDDEEWNGYEQRWRSYLEAKRGHHVVEIRVTLEAKP